ncbi:MAG: hypothetical protein C5S47_07505 [Candidatus Methanogasteraceae archaeon]|nr:MAG: hypothetical protein C5S47_07505 [ANME-2 cluster archaeon]
MPTNEVVKVLLLCTNIFWKLLSVIVWEIDTGAVNRVPSNDGVNLIHYSLNHEKKLVMNYGGGGVST